jgi:DNA replication protein DnaC
MIMERTDIGRMLKELKMPDIREHYQSISTQAANEKWSYEDYLLELLKIEKEGRNIRRISRYENFSQLPSFKRIDNFDSKRLPHNIQMTVSTLISGDFISRNENVLVFGKPGTGKTHFVSALGHELISQGKKVLFTLCTNLVQELLKAKKELNLPKKLKQLSRFDAIIIDEIGYIQQTRDEMEVLFTLLADRYEKGSVIITSNLPFSKWGEIFKDDMLAAAAIDRLVHHSVIIKFDVENYRLEEAAKKEKRKK